MSVLGIIGEILSIFGLSSSDGDANKSTTSAGTNVHVERERGETTDTEPDSEPETEVEEPKEVMDDTAESPKPAEPVPEAPETGASPVDSVSGIGPAYAKRLNDAGVTSVEELVAVDAAEVASETGISEKRIRGWQDTAA
jgi:predicted flap endonuclease-1-like 5' DNA nuclease